MKLKLSLVMLLAVCASRNVLADGLQSTYYDILTSNNNRVDIKYNQPNGTQRTVQTYAGIFTFDTGRYDTTDVNPTYEVNDQSKYGHLANSTLRGYCIDLNNYAKEPRDYRLYKPEYAPIPDPVNGNPVGMGAAKANDLALLWDAAFQSSLTDLVTQAAFQLAVWEVVFETTSAYDVGLNKGTHFASFVSSYLTNNNVVSLANSYLGLIDSSKKASTELVALVNAVDQDFLVEVPTPAAFVQMLGLLSVLGLVRVWQRRKDA